MKWKTTKIEDVCQIVSGTTPSTTIPEYWGGEFNWIAPAEIEEDSKFIFKTQKTITQKAVSKTSMRLLPVGTVLLSSRAPIGKVAIAAAEMYCNQGFKNLICSKEIYNEFLFWFLKGKKEFLNSLGRGATFKEISKDIVSSIEIPLPPLAEQRRIAAILDKADAIRRRRQEALKLADELVKSQFIEMFGDPVTNPKGWKVKPLQELAEVGSSRRVFVEDLVSSGIPFYRGTEVGSLSTGEEITPTLFISEKHYRELCDASGAPKFGDLLMPSLCSDGRIWRVNTTAPFYFKDGRVLWVRLKDNVANSIYLQHALREKLIRDYHSIASGTTFAELKIFALKSMPVMSPPISLQNEFAAFVEQADKSKFALQRQLAEAEALKASLMQQFFTSQEELCA